MRRVLDIPVGDGETLIEPPLDAWLPIMEATNRAAAGWTVPIAGVALSERRERARAEAVKFAVSACERLRVPHRRPAHRPGLIVMTGHQPQFVHPGVWAKHFAIDRCAKTSGALPVDLVVDTDRVSVLAARTPCVGKPGEDRDIVLVRGVPGGCYACAPPPSASQRAAFGADIAACASALPDQLARERVERFLQCLEEASRLGRTLAETVVAARRAYERPVGTEYLELFVTEQSAGETFVAFAAQAIADAERFARVFNEEVAAYRGRTRTRSSSHPFPDLGVLDGAIEIPFWGIVGARRARLWYEPVSGRLAVDGTGTVEVGSDPQQIAARLTAERLRVVPRAMMLTLYQRLFVADLFVHGVGGSRYEAVTDAVIERWLGIAPPPFAVVSLTMRAAAGVDACATAASAVLRRRLQEAEHNPDRLVSMAMFDDEEERASVDALVEEKRSLVQRIAAPSADRKALGAAIRSVNARLREALGPVIASLEAEIQALDAQLAAAAARADREVSFPFFDPCEVAARIC